VSGSLAQAIASSLNDLCISGPIAKYNVRLGLTERIKGTPLRLHGGVEDMTNLRHQLDVLASIFISEIQGSTRALLLPANVEEELVAVMLLLTTQLIKDCCHTVQLTTLYHEIKLTCTPSEPLSQRQLDDLSRRMRTPITPDEDAALWSQAQNATSFLPTWMPHELGVWLNYRVALVVRLLLGDVLEMSSIDLLGSIIGFESKVAGTPKAAFH